MYRDVTFQDEQASVVDIAVVTGKLCRVDFKNEKGHRTQTYLVTNRAVRLQLYDFEKRTEMIWELGDRWQDTFREADRSFLDRLRYSIFTHVEDQRQLLVGDMPEDQLLKRFSASLIKEDKDSVWIHLKPLTPQDRRVYKSIELAIEKKTWLTKRLVVREPNDNSLEWTTKAWQINPEPALTPESLKADLPTDWQKYTLDSAGTLLQRP
jgi:hypothetical protein